MTTIIVTLVAYKVVLLAIGLFAQRRTKNQEDLYLGGRKLGPLVAAISASASSSSVWTLLGVSGMAFSSGLSAIWLFPACVGGFALNWFVVAPRLRRHSAAHNALTLTDVLAGPATGERGRRRVVWLASFITLFCLMTYVATQLNGAGKSFHSAFEGLANIDESSAILLGSVIIVAYTVLGGFWAVSLTDTLQGLVMAVTAVALPIAALIHVDGFGSLFAELQTLEEGKYLSLTSNLGMVAGIGMVIGLSGIALGYPGQPHVVNRFMALPDDNAVRRARLYAMTWAVLVYGGMIILGLCARVGLEHLPNDAERAFFEIARQLFPEVVFGVMLAAVLSAIMSTADSQLLVSASTISHDLGFVHRDKSKQLARDRLVILALTAAAVAAAIYGDKKIFDKVLFAWSGAGAAFGPLLLWILWRGPVSHAVTLATMATGFATCVVCYTGSIKVLDLWNLHGFERNFLPYVAAFLVLVIGARVGKRP